jgi:regulator of replication initiation timing
LLGNSYTLQRKDREINEGKSQVHSMTKQVNDLQIENSNLKGELKNDLTDPNSL